MSSRTFSCLLTRSFPLSHRQTFPPALPPGAPVLRATLEALAATHAKSAVGLPAVRMPDKPLLLDNPTAALPKAAPPRRPARPAPRPRRATRGEAAAGLGGLRTVDAAAVERVAQSWTAATADAVARDGATPATLHPLTVAGACVTVVHAANGRHAGLAGVLVAASRSVWRVATPGGRVVAVARAGTALRVHGPGVEWRVES